MSENQTAEYWAENHAETVAKLAEKVDESAEQVAAWLALVAGDHAEVSDRDAIVTFYSDHELPHEGHVPQFGGGWFCDTCNSPYCELA